jgi:putative ABC transport system permease protein
MVGESVRYTLVQRVAERLGATETIIFSKNSFFEEQLAEADIFEDDAKPILLTSGFVSDAGRYIPVMVWGVDDKNIPEGKALANKTLTDEIGIAGRGRSEGRELVLRLPATGLVPSGSLFVTDNYTTSVRLTFAGVLDKKDGGNLNLKNEQIIPCNVFVNRKELASILKIEGKINLILSANHIQPADLVKVWAPALSGIKASEQKGFTEVTSDRVFLQRDLVETIRQGNPAANRLFSYMANSIASTTEAIPYSFATAADYFQGKKLENSDAILSDYAAQRLHAKLNDSIRLTFFVSGDLKTLHEDSVVCRVAGIVSVGALLADKTLSADFPGLSDVESCTDWDSDLPIDMGRVTKEDEAYWDKYRSTPKVVVAYNAVAEKWSNAYGCATALRTSEKPDMSRLTPAMTGTQLIHPKEAGLNAAKSGVDFASLFLALGIFIIFSAMLLLLVPLSEMFFQRKEEFFLLSALGFSKKRIIRLLWTESFITGTGASFAGVAVGLCYTALILLLLNSLWRGAVHTGGFTFFSSVGALIGGLASGAATALILLRVAIVRAVRKTGKPLRFKIKRRQKEAPFSVSKLIRADLYANRKRAWLSFVALASGVLIVFSVGLNRRGFADSAQLQRGTGGYSLWCEGSAPVYHNMASPEGREKLALKDLPSDVEILQLLRYSADDASCLNLNKVAQPTVLGADMKELKKSSLKIKQSIYPNDASVFDAICVASDSVYPVMVDETVLLWGLQMQLGDVVRYETSKGKTVYLRLAASLQNSIFQGNLLMDKTLFSEVWSEITGSEVALFKVKEQEAKSTAQLISQALSEYGVRVMPASQRLREFNSVTDTYLTIFLVLGGLGLLVGLASFIIVVRKDLASRQEQILLYRTLGFPDRKIARLLTVENRIVPMSATGVGFLASLAGVSGGVGNVSLGIWATALILLLLIIGGVWFFVKKSVENSIKTR